MVNNDSPLGVCLLSCDQFVFMLSDIKSLSALIIARLQSHVCTLNNSQSD